MNANMSGFDSAIGLTQEDFTFDDYFSNQPDSIWGPTLFDIGQRGLGISSTYTLPASDSFNDARPSPLLRQSIASRSCESAPTPNMMGNHNIRGLNISLPLTALSIYHQNECSKKTPEYPDPEELALSPSDPYPRLSHSEYRYRNAVLGDFEDPATPLQVIDQHSPLLAEEVTRHLQQELNRQEQLKENQDNYKVSQSLCKNMHKQLDAKPMRVTKNKRQENIKKLNPRRFYTKTPPAPRSWGSINPATGDHMFRYTLYSELLPQDRFTPEQIIEFIGNHPNRCQPDGGMVLWLQLTPSDSSNRYPTKNSDKCRFVDCPVPHHTIHKGAPRVAFDELHSQQTPGVNYDPFHCAMYTHLFCFEKFLNFPHICKNPLNNVRPDTRELVEGKNRMALTRDHASMKPIAEKYMQESVSWDEYPPNRNRPEKYHELTLTYRIIKEHIENQYQRFQIVREQRNGNSIDVHFGNLDVYAANEKVKVRRKNGQRPSSSNKNKLSPSLATRIPTGKFPSKRKRSSQSEGEEEDFVLDGTILDSDYTLQRRSSPKRMKRSNGVGVNIFGDSQG
ncbi:hypothetical protein BGZ60DRAFT_72523 [Tricladium varicosporioides]|nr:hypothetical protein BGZ60DRAFT_72523 [Hymenoscyphus varicosporioides]